MVSFCFVLKEQYSYSYALCLCVLLMAAGTYLALSQNIPSQRIEICTCQTMAAETNLALSQDIPPQRVDICTFQRTYISTSTDMLFGIFIRHCNSLKLKRCSLYIITKKTNKQ